MPTDDAAAAGSVVGPLFSILSSKTTGIASSAAEPLLDKPEEKIDAVLGSAEAMGSSTGQLSLVSMLAFTLPVAEMMFFVPGDLDMTDRSVMEAVAQWIYVLALPLSSALSAYPITFAILEVYYIGYVKSLVEERKGATTQATAETAAADSVLARRFVATLDRFNNMRARARNCMWGAMCSLMVGIAAKFVSMAGATPIAVAAAAILCTGATCVLLTVSEFRRAYWPLLNESRRPALRHASSIARREFSANAS